MADEHNATPEADATAEPVVEGSETTSEPTEYDKLKSFMAERDLKSPDDLTGYVDSLGTTEEWQQKYGASENKVGDLRRKVESLEAKTQDPAYQPEYGEQPVNIKQIVGQEIRTVFGEMQKQQQETSMKYLVERNDLMKRPGWKDVQEHFDKALMDPQIQLSIQNGRLTQDRLYSQINERVLAARVNSMIDNLPKGALSQPPPNTETSDRQKQPAPEVEAKQQRIQKAKDDQNVEALLKELIPDDDPIVRY
jgi:hypothetical protein